MRRASNSLLKIINSPPGLNFRLRSFSKVNRQIFPLDKPLPIQGESEGPSTEPCRTPVEGVGRGEGSSPGHLVGPVSQKGVSLSHPIPKPESTSTGSITLHFPKCTVLRPAREYLS
ncbi:hypothetical protein AAFF_G00040680 [Aldrovandia affinis]|uniref:Uncharacterized protein n=1 Tax=Aldrovandia affinis TaxID=143900 RepID=A0AAD7S2S3_9TELE|nr:hypothetical protein AAFF_G00040680 [Aldrovandia affinis]